MPFGALDSTLSTSVVKSTQKCMLRNKVASKQGLKFALNQKQKTKILFHIFYFILKTNN